MKYLVIIAIVVILVRIDFVLSLIGKGISKIQRANAPEVSETPTQRAAPIPMSQDPNFVINKKVMLINFLKDYRIDLNSISKENILTLLKKDPTLLNEQLDPDFDSTISTYLDLLQQRKTGALQFLIELLPLLRGENQESVKRVISSYIEVDFEELLKFYQSANDTNCTIVSRWPSLISDEEKFLQLTDRLELIGVLIAKEDGDKSLLPQLQTCQLALKLYLDKLKANLPKNPEPATPTEDGATQTEGENNP